MQKVSIIKYWWNDAIKQNNWYKLGLPFNFVWWINYHSKRVISSLTFLLTNKICQFEYMLGEHRGWKSALYLHLQQKLIANGGFK